MSSEQVIRRIVNLKQEKLNLQNLLKSTEQEVLKIIKRNNEESLRVKQLLDSALPLNSENTPKRTEVIVDRNLQTESSLVNFYSTVALEEELVNIKESLISTSTAHRLMKSKLERRKKKNKMLEDLIKQYQERVEILDREKISLKLTIESSREEQKTILDHIKYQDLIGEPTPCEFIIKQ